MTKSRRYAPEYRRQMLELVRTVVRREIECSAQTIRNWVRQADLHEGRRSDGLPTAERDELRRLRRENQQLREERAIPKKGPRPGSMGSGLVTTLMLDALDMALGQRDARGLIHHSDSGAQYTSVAFGKRCREAGVTLSMRSVGDCYDNALCLDEIANRLSRTLCSANDTQRHRPITPSLPRRELRLPKPSGQARIVRPQARETTS